MDNNNKFTEIAYIYALKDPFNFTIRYVGKTIHPKSRLSDHISECRNIKVQHRRARWIRTLLKKDIRPIFECIKICPLSDYEYHESFYIKKYMSDKLTNSDESDQGNKKRKKDVIDRVSKKNSKCVYQYDLSGNFMKKHQGIRTAAKELNISHSNISRCCNSLFKHSGGFIFSYEKKEVNKVVNPNAVRKQVVEIDKFGNEIDRWESIMECSRKTGIDNGNISRVCNGISKHIKKRFFIFS